ncbi:MAG TPA: hypothetical protein PKY25_01745 [Bacilli bacterium]|nr:hypothetical protein [Bacilli bacterium]
MKIINKIKNFIFDAEEEKAEKLERKEHKEEKEEPKEKKQVEIIDDIIDDDFKNIPPKKRFDFDRDFFPETRAKEEPPKEIIYQSPSYRKESKRFKPTPMISPVFGLISVSADEKINEKLHKEEKEINPFDAVRQKAYGTLTDEIEDTLTRLNKGNFYKPPQHIKKEKEEEKEIIYKEETIEIKTHVDDEETKEFDNTDTQEKIKFETIDIEKQFNKDKEEEDDDTKESDLFNLIETMYEGSEDDK